MRGIFRIMLLVGIIFSMGSGMYYFNNLRQEKADSELTLYGNVDIRQVNLGFRVFGRLDKLLFEEGDRVKKGDLLAALDAVPYQDKVNAATADLDQRRAAHQNASHISNRKKKLAASKFASQEDYETTKTAADEAKAQIESAVAALNSTKTQLDDTTLESPSNGTILSRVREVGAIVNPGEIVYVLSLDQPMWVRAYVSEPDLGKIKLGMKALVTTDSRPNKPYIGQVGFISPVAEFTPKNVETPELRTSLVYRMRIIISNPDPYLRQGMPVTVRFPKS